MTDKPFQGGPPKRLWLSPVMRRTLDVEVALTTEPSATDFREPAFVADISGQLKKLKNQILIYYVITFVGAFIVASGGIPTSTTVEAFGVTMPLGLLSQQALAAVVAGLFSQYVIVMLSYSLMYGAITAQMKGDFGEGWEYRIARYDGGVMYGSLLFPKLIGYRSPKREMAFILLGFITALMSVVTHAAIVIGSAFIAFYAARSANAGALTMTLSVFALVGTVLPAVLWVAAVFVPMPYRLPKEA